MFKRNTSRPDKNKGDESRVSVWPPREYTGWIYSCEKEKVRRGTIKGITRGKNMPRISAKDQSVADTKKVRKFSRLRRGH